MRTTRCEATGLGVRVPPRLRAHVAIPTVTDAEFVEETDVDAHGPFVIQAPTDGRSPLTRTRRETERSDARDSEDSIGSRILIAGSGEPG